MYLRFVGLLQDDFDGNTVFIENGGMLVQLPHISRQILNSRNQQNVVKIEN